MWRTYNDSGTLTHSFHDSMVAMHPYYFARGIGGMMYLTGTPIAFYNIVMTIRIDVEPDTEFVSPDKQIGEDPETTGQMGLANGAKS